MLVGFCGLVVQFSVLPDMTWALCHATRNRQHKHMLDWREVEGMKRGEDPKIITSVRYLKDFENKAKGRMKRLEEVIYAFRFLLQKKIKTYLI